MPFNLGGPELIIVLVIVLIVFGAGKLPKVMGDFGRGMKEFKKAQTDEEIAASAAASAQSAKTTSPATSNGATTANGVTSTPHGTEPAPREPAPRA